MRLIKKVITELILDNKKYDVEILYKSQKRNISFRYKKEENKFIISSPIGISYKKLLERLNVYAYKLINKVNNSSTSKTLICDEYVYILGHKIILNDNHIIKYENQDIIYDDIDDLKNKLNLKFYNLAKSYLNYYQKMMNINDNIKLRTKYLKSRYGSYSKKTKTIVLNTTLYHYDISYLEAVIVHELAHYFELNHSIRFYNIVYKYYPNYKTIHKKLQKGVINGNN